MKNGNYQKFSAGTFYFLVAILLICSCNGKMKQPALPVGESFLTTENGKIWYKITGTGNGLPVVLLHGGPGYASNYLKPFEELGNDRQVIRYDQLGSRKSDRITDTALFKIQQFINDLESLRQHLDIKKWHLLGHSWGTIMAMEYYKLYPEHVASITFGSAALNIHTWQEHARELLLTLPQEFQDAIKNAEMTGNYNDSLYQAANNLFMGTYMVRNPVMAEMDSLYSTMNYEMYLYMQGPSEFTITGTLKDYDATPYLPEIKVPTLFTVGEFDEAGPEIIKSYADKVPGSQYIILSGAAHITMWDATEENVRVVREFLNLVDPSKTNR